MKRNIWCDGIVGVVVGDALGLPVQFWSRENLKQAPIESMMGYGTFYMPAGTWSDDSSMTLATLASIRNCKCIDTQDIMKQFVRWLYLGEYTPFEESFDQGKTCTQAIMDYVKNQDVNTCGQIGEYANGNGALMRIMPVCLWAYEKQKDGSVSEKEAVEWIHEVSGLTHNHLRSKMACVIYYYMIKAILETDGSLQKKLQKGVDDAVKFYHGDIANYVELAHYERLFHLDEFARVPEDDIKSSGYVVDSLEAAVWSLITTESFENALLKAVNLGGDTDTIGAIAGGLAGLYYGYEGIPEEWLEVVQKREWVEGMCEV